MDNDLRVSNAFETFYTQAPEHAQAWSAATDALAHACALDVKTRHLAYLGILAALGLESGVPFHVGLCKQAGASREEVISAVLLGLPAAGLRVIGCLPHALSAYDTSKPVRA